MPNRWVEFVKDFAARNNISYGCAITNTDCRVEYGIIKAGSMPKLKKPKNPKMIIENEGETTPALDDIEFGITPRRVYESPRQRLPMPMPYKQPVYQDLEEAVPSEYPLMKNIMIPQRVELGNPMDVKEVVMKDIMIQRNPVRQLSTLYDFEMPREEREIPRFKVLKIDGKKYLAFEKDYNNGIKRSIKIFDYEKGKEGYVVKIGKYLKDIGDVLLDL
jgi:hypothetical protein